MGFLIPYNNSAAPMSNLGYNGRMPAKKTDSAVLPAGIAMRPFTEAQFHCMTALIPQMSQDDQDKIRAYLCAPKEHPIAGLMTRMIESSSVLAKEFEAQPFDEMRMTLGPLLFWGLTQDWAKECDVPGCLLAWSQRLTSQSHPTNLGSAILGLGVLPLLALDTLQLDRAARERLRGDVYRTMQAMVPWKNQTSANDMVLGPLWQLAASCPSEKVGKTNLRVHWAQCMRQTMSTASVADQKHTLENLMANGLAGSSLLTTFKAANPLVWLMPEFRNTLISILPEAEAARCKAMVWTPNTWQSPVGQQRIRPGEVNRQLYAQYCPLLYLGLEMVVQKVDDWEDRAYIKAFTTEFTKPTNPENIDLPEDLLADAPTQ